MKKRTPIRDRSPVAPSKRAPSRPDTVETLNVNSGSGGDGPGGLRCDRTKYEAVKTAMLKVVPRSETGILFKDLAAGVAGALPGGQIPGGGSIPWYVTVVKLDLEARGLIERIPGSKPQRLRRPSAARKGART